MNKIWVILMLLCSCILLVINPESLMAESIISAKATIELCINLFAIYCVWLGLLEIADETGITKKLAKLLKPIICPLIKTKNEKAIESIALNFSANLIGLGNIATPSGINAMQLLDDKSGKVNYSQMMLYIINACSIGLIPTTIIGMRIAQGSSSASDIILPTFLTTLITAIIGILGVVIFGKKLRKK